MAQNGLGNEGTEIFQNWLEGATNNAFGTRANRGDSGAGFPVIMAFCHRYPQYMEGLHAVYIDKSLGSSVERQSFDGVTYQGARAGICTLSFVNDLSESVLLGDIIYVIRATPTGGQNKIADIANQAANVNKRDLTDLRGTVIFQGICVAQGWSQTVGGDRFDQTYNIEVADMTAFLMDQNMFGRRYIEGKGNPSLLFDKFLRKEYGVDINRVYQRGDLVDKIIRKYIDKRINNKNLWTELFSGGLIDLGIFQRLIGQGASQKLGLRFDGAIDAYDFIKASDVFSGRNPTISLWDYLTDLASSPLYEVFVTEDSGRLVFRRAAWDRIGTLAGRVYRTLNAGAVDGEGAVADAENKALAQKGQSALHIIPGNSIIHAKLMKSSHGIKDIIMLSKDGDTMKNSRLADEYLSRFGVNFYAPSIRLYDPELTTRCSNVGSSLEDALAAGASLAGSVATGVVTPIGTSLLEQARKKSGSSIKQILGMKYYHPMTVQDNILRQNIANIFRGSITLKEWQNIAIGDHVKIAEPLDQSVYGNPLLDGANVLENETFGRYQTGFRGHSARTEDFIFYVTRKSYNAVVGGDANVIQENLHLGLNYGGLEFVDLASPLRLKIIHK